MLPSHSKGFSCENKDHDSLSHTPVVDTKDRSADLSINKALSFEKLPRAASDEAYIRLLTRRYAFTLWVSRRHFISPQTPIIMSS